MRAEFANAVYCVVYSALYLTLPRSLRRGGSTVTTPGLAATLRELHAETEP